MNVYSINFIVRTPEGMKKEDLSESILEYAYYGDLDGLKRAILEYPDCINFSDDFTGATALHFSAGLGNYSCVNFLLSVPGIDVRQLDNDGKSAMDYAVRTGHNEIFKLLADRVFPNRHNGAKLGLQ